MDAKVLKTFIGYSGAFGWLYYMGSGLIEYYKRDDQLEATQMLDDELMDRIVDILSDAAIKKKRKYKYNFVANKENIEFVNLGKFNMVNKLIGLPTNFTIKDDTKLDEFLIKLNDKFKDKELDFLKHKHLFKITDKELEFAILFQIYRSNFDLRIIDSVFIALLGMTSFNLVSFVIKSKEAKVVTASILYLIFIIGYFLKRGQVFDEYSIMKISNSNNLELLEAGLKYVNKNIQLNEFLGKSTRDLKYQFKILKLEYENLKKLNDQTVKPQQSNQTKEDIELEQKLQKIRERKREATKEHLKKISNVSSTI